MNPVTRSNPAPGGRPGAGPLDRWRRGRPGRRRAAPRGRVPVAAGAARRRGRRPGRRTPSPFGARLRDARRRAGGRRASSSSARARSRSRRRADRRAFVAAAGAGGSPGASPTTATPPTSWRSPAPDDARRPPRPARRQRAAALAGRGRRLRGRRPAPALAARRRHRRTARPRAARRPPAPVDLATVEIGRRASEPARRRPGGRPPDRTPRELLVAGRTSPRAPGAGSKRGDARRGPGRSSRSAACGRRDRRPAAAGVVLGALLDRDGPASLGGTLARFGDAAIIDTRVLLAHRLGRGRGGLAGRRGPLRLRPAAPRAHRRPVAAGADGVGRRPHRSRSCSAATRSSGPGCPRSASVEAAAGPTVDVTPGLRRDPPPDLDAVGEDEALVARIRDEIERDGPMTFARFMDLALYDPDGGYYRAAAARPGSRRRLPDRPRGAPDLRRRRWRGPSPTSGTASGRPDPFVVREHGAGTGALALAILDGLARRTARPGGGRPLRAGRGRPAPRRGARERRLAAPATVAARRTDRGPARRSTGVVLANEVLDALPVHRVVQRGRRRCARSASASTATASSTSRPTRRRRPSPPGSRRGRRARRRPARRGLPRARRLDRATPPPASSAASLLLIDYGYPAAELYDPVRRRDGTLRAYLRHRVHDDPYRPRRPPGPDRPRRRDGRRAAPPRAPGSTTSGPRPRPSPSSGLGIEERLRAIQADPATTMEAYLAVRSALMRLLDPAAMGRFRVMAFGRGWPADARRLAAAGVPRPR